MRLLLPSGVRGRSVAWPAAAPGSAGAARAEQRCWCCLPKAGVSQSLPEGSDKTSCWGGCCVLNFCVPMGTLGTPSPQGPSLHPVCQGRALHCITGLRSAGF